LLHLRRVLEDAAGFDDALRLLSKQRLTTPGLFTLVGSRNEQRVVVERAPTRFAHRWAEPGQPLLTTNDYRLLDQRTGADAFNLERTSCSRYDRLWHLATHTAAPTDDQLLYWLSDPEVRQDITAQHVLMRPARGELRLFVPRELIPN
jgi:hypothetical protein